MPWNPRMGVWSIIFLPGVESKVLKQSSSNQQWVPQNEDLVYNRVVFHWDDSWKERYHCDNLLIHILHHGYLDNHFEKGTGYLIWSHRDIRSEQVCGHVLAPGDPWQLEWEEVPWYGLSQHYMHTHSHMCKSQGCLCQYEHAHTTVALLSGPTRQANMMNHTIDDKKQKRNEK